ncbi:MAG: response regulator transcription factor [Thermoleophilia bacterium]|nr:response regulator transcription factor [Thermoleophilia bacterium]
MTTIAPVAHAPAPTPTLLLVEPSEPMRGFLRHHLTAERYAVLATTDAADARRALARGGPDIAVIALDGGGAAGLDLIAHIREGDPRGAWDPGMPIVAVGRDADPFSVARALARGADDHVARPVHIAELAARASALMRRARGQTLRDEVRVGTLLVDRRGRRASVNGVGVGLSAKEFALLDALARDPFRVLTKDELLRDVWGYVSAGRTRTVDSHASRLRRKLAAAGGGERFVANVWGVGYRLLPEAA